MNGHSQRSTRIMPVSTGNDIVSLRLTNRERTLLPRFYSRILTAAEQELYCRLEIPALPFDHYVWLCWSVKESAYKYVKRSQPGLEFSPLQFCIRRLVLPGDLAAGGSMPAVEAPAAGDSAGDPVPEAYPETGSFDVGALEWAAFSAGGYCASTILFGPRTLYARSVIRDGIVVSMVSEDEQFTATRFGIRHIASAAYAEQASAVRAFALAALKGALHRDDLRLQKDPAGCPIVLAGEQQLDIPVSLSHHDQYVAFSFHYSATVPVPDAG